MKKLLGFICALLIAVFAVMPNTYAEAQKDYGNLDMNRWVVVEEVDNNNILVDKLSIEYFDKDGSKLCNLWMCTFDKDKKSYVLDNITLIYEKRMFSLNDTIYFDSKGKIKKIIITQIRSLAKQFQVQLVKVFITLFLIWVM